MERNMKIRCDGMWITIEAGATIKMMSPGWDGDRPDTQVTITGVLQHEIVVQVADSIELNMLSAQHTPDKGRGLGNGVRVSFWDTDGWNFSME
jgi:hypothetical protein